MKQPIWVKSSLQSWGEANSTVPFGVTGHNFPASSGGSRGVFPAAGILDSFLLTVPSSSTSLTIGGVSLSASAGNPGTSASTVAVSAGSTLEVSLSSAPPLDYRIAYRFTGNNSNEAIMLGHAIEGAGTVTKYCFPFTNNGISGGGSGAQPTTTESEHYFYAPTNFTIKSFYVTANLTGGGQRTWTIMKNGSPTAATVDSLVSMNITGLTIPVAVGDTLTVKFTSVENVWFTNFAWGIMYNPDIDGESIVGGTIDNAPTTSTGVVQFAPLWGSDNAWSATESDFTGVINNHFTVKKFRVDLSAAPGAGNNRRFRVRKNGNNILNTVDISDSATTAMDSASFDHLIPLDEMSISHEVTSASVNNTPFVRWSAVLVASIEVFVSETVTVSESLTMLPNYSINVHETVTLTEGSVGNGGLTINSNAPSTPTLYIGTTGTLGKEIYQFLDSLTDNGNPINFNVETHNMPFTALFETIVEPRSVLVEVKEGNNVVIYVAYDDGAFMQIGTVKRGYTEIPLDADPNDDNFPRCRSMKIALREYSSNRCTISRLAVIYYETQDNEEERL